CSLRILTCEVSVALLAMLVNSCWSRQFCGSFSISAIVCARFHERISSRMMGTDLRLYGSTLPRLLLVDDMVISMSGGTSGCRPSGRVSHRDRLRDRAVAAPAACRHWPRLLPGL